MFKFLASKPRPFLFFAYSSIAGLIYFTFLKPAVFIPIIESLLIPFPPESISCPQFPKLHSAFPTQSTDQFECQILSIYANSHWSPFPRILQPIIHCIIICFGWLIFHMFISYFTSWFVNSFKNRYHGLHGFAQLQRLAPNWFVSIHTWKKGRREEGSKGRQKIKRMRRKNYSSLCTETLTFLTLDRVAVASTQF